MNRTAELHPGQDHLKALALGRVDDARFDAMEQHVAQCSTCAAALVEAPEDSFIDLLRGTQSFADTDHSLAEQGTLATPMPARKEDLTAVWPEGDKTGSVEAPAALANHPRYRPLHPLGHGGMGAVWLAEHKLMGRSVAVKVIRAEFLNRPGAAERFRREVQSAARLHHPNIVTAFDADQTGDAPLLAMEYVEGTSLAEEVRRRGPLPITEVCAVVRQAALGLQHAHDRGLVHRDLKPQNLMRTADGTVKILDFGLAVLHDAGAGQGQLTGANMVVGTPDYIAPEQAEDSRKADFRSDIYALGCTLYHLLTGRVPFPEESVLKKLDAHRLRQPEPIRKLRPEVPEGLAAVVEKMMAKRPADRFASAASLVVALDPFTRPTAPPRRRRSLVAAALTLLGAGIILIAGVVFYIMTDNGAIEIRTEDKNIKVIAEDAGGKITIMDPASKQTWVIDTGTYTVRLQDNPDGLAIDLPQTFTLKRGDKQVVMVKRVKGPIGIDPESETHKILGQLEGTWRMVSWQANGAEVPKPAETVTWTFKGDQQLVKLNGNYYQSATVKLIEPGVLPCKADLVDMKGADTIDRCSAIFKIEGDTLYWRQSYSGAPRPTIFGSSKGSDGNYSIWKRVRADEVGRVQPPVAVKPGLLRSIGCPSDDPHWNHVSMVVYTSNGKQLVIGGDTGDIRVLDAESGQEVRRFAGGEKSTWMFVPSPDGRRLVAAGRLWDIDTGKEIRTFEGQAGAIAFTPNGRQLLAWREQTLHLLDVETGKELRKVEHPEGVTPAVSNQITTAFTPDGKQVVSACSDHNVRLWNLETGEIVRTFAGHTEPVGSAVLSPDGTRLLTASDDKTVRLWDLATGKELHKLEGHTDKSLYAIFSPDGRRALSRSHLDRTVRLWNLATGEQLVSFTLEEWRRPNLMAFSPDGRQAAVASWRGYVYIYQLPEPDLAGVSRPAVEKAEAPQFLMPSNRTGNFEIYLMNLDGTVAKRLTNGAANNRYPTWSPDGSKIAFTSDRDGAGGLYVMDASGANVKLLGKDPAGYAMPAWSPDGTKIVFYRTKDKELQLFVVDAQGGQEQQLTNLKGEGNGWDPSWSPDGKKITFASTRNGKGAHIYVMDADGQNVKEITTVGGHFGWVNPAWSPDGRKIAFTLDTTFPKGVELFVCDPDGKDLKQLTEIGGINTHAAWSPDSKQIIFQHLEFGRVDQPGPVYIMDADGGNQRVLLHREMPGWPDRAAWKPAAGEKKVGEIGRVEPPPETPRFLFASNRTGNFEIYLMNQDGAGAKNLTNSNASDSSPAWSPDGSRIVFISDRDGSNQFYIMDASGTNVQQLTKGPGNPGGLAWSADGTKILFDRDTGNGSQLYVMEARGANVQQLTKGPGNPRGLIGSPDGTKILFVRDTDKGPRHYVMDVQGGQEHPMTKDDGDALDLCWSPDGKKIAFWSGRGGNGWDFYVVDAGGKNLKKIKTSGSVFGWLHPA